MESVLLVELSAREDVVRVVAEHPRSEYGEVIGSLCFPYPELLGNEYRKQGGLESPMLLVTEKNAKTTVESRILAYTRRFCLPCSESGRFDVGTCRVMAGVVTTRRPDSSWNAGEARSLLAALEGELMMGGDFEQVVKKLFNPSLSPRLGLPAAEVGGLCRRLRSAADVRRLASAVLCERRVIFYGSHELDVSRCVLGAAAIPELAFGPEVLHYPHVVAPLLSSQTLAYAGSPSPYVVGIHASKLESTVEEFVGHSFRDDIVLVDVDEGVVGCLGASPSLHFGNNLDDSFCGEFNATVGAAIRRGDAARRDGRIYEKKRRELARKAAMDKVSASARKAANKALSTARGRLFSRGGGAASNSSKNAYYKNNGQSDEDETVVAEEFIGVEDEEDDRFFFDHYFEEEDDSRREAIDASLCDVFGSFLRAILGTRQFVLPKDIQGALDDARELFVADRCAKSPSLEAFARDFSQSQMFAAWALERSAPTTKLEEEEEEEIMNLPPRDEVSLLLGSLSNKFEQMTDLDLALAAFGEVCRHAPLRASCDLAVTLFPKVECLAALRRTAAIVMDDEASRRRRKRPSLTRGERNARLGAVAMVLAALLRGPSSCVATVANQLVKPLRRSAKSDEDVDVRDCSSLALRLCLDVDGSLKEARLHFLQLSHISPVLVTPFPQHLTEAGSKFPDFAQLHAAGAPDRKRNHGSLPEMIDLLGIEQEPKYPPPLPQRPPLATIVTIRDFSSSDSAASDTSPTPHLLGETFDEESPDKRPTPSDPFAASSTRPTTRPPPPDLLDISSAPRQRQPPPPPPDLLLGNLKTTSGSATRPPPPALAMDYRGKEEDSTAVRRRPPPPPPGDAFAASNNGASARFGRPSPPPPPTPDLDLLSGNSTVTSGVSPARPAPPPLPTHNVSPTPQQESVQSSGFPPSPLTTSSSLSRPSPPPLPTAMRRPVPPPPVPPLPPRRE